MSVSDGERIMETQTQAPSSIDELEAELRDIRELLKQAWDHISARQNWKSQDSIDAAINRLDTILGE
jgi:hypothetical protein